MNKAVFFGIGIVIIGALFVIQDLGFQTNTDPNAPDPNEEPDKFNSPEPATQQVESQNQCDSSYPDVCIPHSPPDLDCGEIGYSNFRVIPPDPHRFDGDKDGIGCES
jgi:hypothetical protein